MVMWWCIVSSFGGREEAIQHHQWHSLGYHAWQQLSRKREKEREGGSGEGGTEGGGRGEYVPSLIFPIKYLLDNIALAWCTHVNNYLPVRVARFENNILVRHCLSRFLAIHMLSAECV